MRRNLQAEMTTALPGVSAGHEVNLTLNPDTEQGPYPTVTQEVDPEVLHTHIDPGATPGAEAGAGTAEIAPEAGVVPTTVTRAVVAAIAGVDPGAVPMVTTVDPAGPTPMTATTAGVGAGARGATATGDLGATTGDPGPTAPTATAIAATPTTGAPVRAADTAENAPLRMEAVFQNFFSVIFKKTVLTVSQVKVVC